MSVVAPERPFFVPQSSLANRAEVEIRPKTMHATLIRGFMLLIGLLLLAGCKSGYVQSVTNVRHTDFDIEKATPAQVEQSRAALHQWLSRNGYKKLTSTKEIAKATSWSGNPSVYSEVYTKEISSAFPDSVFTVTFLDREPEKFFRLTLTSTVAGSRAAHASQEPLVKSEEASFQMALRDSKTD